MAAALPIPESPPITKAFRMGETATATVRLLAMIGFRFRPPGEARSALGLALELGEWVLFRWILQAIEI